MKTSPLKSIHRHCFACVVDPQYGNGSKHSQTEACTSYQCDLYKYRPVTTAEKSRRSAEKLNSMSEAEQKLFEANRAKKAKAFRERMNKDATKEKAG